jgi:hypothetical protein
MQNPEQGTWRLHAGMEDALQKLTSQSAMLALLFELKLKRKGVRLTVVERKRIRAATEKYFKTNDASVFNDAVVRSRKIHIRFTSKDLRLLTSAITDTVEATVTKTTKDLSCSLEPKMRRWADQECAWFIHQYAAFRFRNARLWKEPFRHFARFRWAAAQVGEVALAHFREQQILNTNRLATALILLHARACLVAGEVEALMQAGYPDGAAARWRTLHEIAVTAAFLVEHGEETAKRYLSHLACEENRSSQAVERNRHKFGYRTLGKRYLRVLEAEVLRLKHEHGDDFRHDYGWAAKALNQSRVNFAQIEEAVKLDFMRPFYRLASEQVHASARGALVRAGLIDQMVGNADIVTGPSNYGFADTGANSARSLLLATVSLGQAALTVDTNVIMLVMTRWLTPLREKFLLVQQGIERREARIRAREGQSAR